MTPSILPIYWDDIDANMEPLQLIDAWNYLERMTLYKYLVLNVNHCEWDNNDHKLID